MNSSGALRCFARAVALFSSLLLASCATQPLVIDDPDWLRHEASVMALDDWALSGRLIVRQESGNDSVNINWRQQDERFDLRLFGGFGLGTVRIHGTDGAVTVEQAGEETVTLPGLEAVTQEYFGYAFPTAELLYWVRGLPAPARAGSNTLDDNRMLATLRQDDAAGLEWELSFDRYRELEGGTGTTYLPGRIIARREGLELQFQISRWEVPDTP